MKEAVAGHFHAPCSQAWWALVGATDPQRLVLQDSINSIRDLCMARSTQVLRLPRRSMLKEPSAVFNSILKTGHCAL